jgi:hypothetical protein
MSVESNPSPLPHQHRASTTQSTSTLPHCTSTPKLRCKCTSTLARCIKCLEDSPGSSGWSLPLNKHKKKGSSGVRITSINKIGVPLRIISSHKSNLHLGTAGCIKVWRSRDLDSRSWRYLLLGHLVCNFREVGRSSIGSLLDRTVRTSGTGKLPSRR